MNHRASSGTGRNGNPAAASASADLLESQNEALLSSLQGKISNLKNVRRVMLARREFDSV